MYITPIQLKSIANKDIFQQSEGKNNQIQFSNVFQQAWDNAASAKEDLTNKQYLQSIGEIEDIHTIPIAASKAELSLSLMVNLRNKALESYNELIRMSI